MIEMNRFTCYALSVECTVRVTNAMADGSTEYSQQHISPRFGTGPYAVYWVSSPSTEQLAVGALTIMYQISNQRDHTEPQANLNYGTTMEWFFDELAPMQSMLEATALAVPPEEVFVSQLGTGTQQQPIWPWVVGAAALFG